MLLDAYHFVANEPNPLMQAVYLTLVCGIFYLYINTAFPVISDYRCMEAWVCVLTTLAIFAWACLSEPTVVTKRNQDRLSKQYKPDGIVYPLDDKRKCKRYRVSLQPVNLLTPSPF